METLTFSFDGGRAPAPFAPTLVGVVASGNLEVLVEPSADTGCRIAVDTSARGFGPVWEAVLRDFHERHGIAGIAIAIHDMGATPAVVSLRLDQAMAAIEGDA
ncbi:MAG: malonate decarboxylase acyl carrier protein [Burkholderiaceae bacterium]